MFEWQVITIEFVTFYHLQNHQLQMNLQNHRIITLNIKNNENMLTYIVYRKRHTFKKERCVYIFERTNELPIPLK